MTNLTNELPVDEQAAKKTAARIKARLEEMGYKMPLSHAYQALAANHGYEDWATMKAVMEKRTARTKVAAPEEEMVRVTFRGVSQLLPRSSVPAWVINPPDQQRLIRDLSEPAELWGPELEKPYIALCQWLVEFSEQISTLTTAMEHGMDGIALRTCAEIPRNASGKLRETEQALTLLHEIAVPTR